MKSNGSYHKSTYHVPSNEEVMTAVRSLYADNLEPFGRILLRRIRERHPAISRNGNVDDAPLVDPKHLHKICKVCPGVVAKEVDGNEITVWLLDQPAIFVDVCSPIDPYPQSLWTAASAYFNGLRGNEILLPGGRYACAYALAVRGLSWLSALSLGEICHVVQLAVSQRKLLGYIDGNMVPYNHSEESVKEHCAVYQRPFCNPTKKLVNTPFPVATWEEARACLSAILRTTSIPEIGGITVSNVKRIFRSRFGLDLSETALGYSRLSELLQDTRLEDICAVEMSGAGQFIIRPRPRFFRQRHAHQVERGAVYPSHCPPSPHYDYASVWGPSFGETSIDPSVADLDGWEAVASAMGVCLSTNPLRSNCSIRGPPTEEGGTIDPDSEWLGADILPSVAPPPGLDLANSSEMEPERNVLGLSCDILGKELRRLLALDEEGRRNIFRDLCGKSLKAGDPLDTDDTVSTIANSDVMGHLGSGDSWRSALEIPSTIDAVIGNEAPHKYAQGGALDDVRFLL